MRGKIEGMNWACGEDYDLVDLDILRNLFMFIWLL